jgi:hypothetical protein
LLLFNSFENRGSSEAGGIEFSVLSRGSIGAAARRHNECLRN